MAVPATSQSVGNVTEEVPDIMAEQAAFAAANNAATAKIDAENPTIATKPAEVDKGYVAPTEDDSTDPDLDTKFAAAQGKTLPAKKVEVADTTKPAAVTAPVVKTDKVVHPRILDDLDEPLRPLFKAMSNEAHDTLKPIVIEAKKQKERVTALEQELQAAKQGRIPDSYYENEMAYVLTPEFAQKSNEATIAEQVLAHWEQQYAEVRGGAKTVIPLLTNAQGQIVQGAPVEADRNTEMQVGRLLTQAQHNSIQAQANVTALAQTHKNNAAQAKSWVNDFQSRAFPAFDKDEALKAMVADTQKQFHPALQANPLASMLARAIVTTTLLGKQLQAKAGTATNVPVKQAATQPSAAVIAGGGSSSAKNGLVDESDLANEFKRAMKGLPLNGSN